MRRLATSAVALAGLSVLAVSTPAGATSQAQVKAKALSLSDMPTGWSVNNAALHSPNAGCLIPVFRGSNLTIAKVHYADSGNLPTLDEEVAASKSASKAFASNVKRLNACHTAKVTSQGQTVTYSIGQLSYPKVGNQSAAYNVSFTVSGITGSEDIVIWRSGSYLGGIALGDEGSVDTSLLQTFVSQAVSKIQGKAVTPPTGS